MINTWLDLQEARKILKLLKKKGSKIDKNRYRTNIVDENGNTIYAPTTMSQEFVLSYTIECFKNKAEINMIDLVNYMGD